MSGITEKITSLWKRVDKEITNPFVMSALAAAWGMALATGVMGADPSKPFKVACLYAHAGSSVVYARSVLSGQDDNKQAMLNLFRFVSAASLAVFSNADGDEGLAGFGLTCAFDSAKAFGQNVKQIYDVKRNAQNSSKIVDTTVNLIPKSFAAVNRCLPAPTREKIQLHARRVRQNLSAFKARF